MGGMKARKLGCWEDRRAEGLMYLVIFFRQRQPHKIRNTKHEIRNEFEYQMA